MKRLNVSYVEVLKNGNTLASCFEASEPLSPGSTQYGSVGDSAATPDLFHKLIEDMVIPKVVPVDGNKVTKLSLHLMDGYDCYYTTTPADDSGLKILVCFTKSVIPKILPIRLLSELKHQDDSIDSDTELSLKVGEIIDIFHEELRSFSNEQWSEDAEATESDLQDILKVMNDNIDKFLQRQERISLLVDKTSQLNNSSHTFKRKTNRIKQRMWWHRVKNITLLVFAIILTISAIIFFFLIGRP